MINSVLAQGIGVMNEDALVINETAQIYGVIDGVTSLKGILINNITPGKRATDAVKQAFEQVDANITLNNATELANASIQSAIDVFNIVINHPKDCFQCCHAVVKLHDTKADFTSSADCVIYTVSKSNEVTQVIPSFKKTNESNRVKQWQEKYPGVYESDTLPQEMIEAIDNAKSTANVPGGYSVMNGDVNFNHAYNRGEIDTTDLSHILITTDGFYDIEHLGLDNFVLKFVQDGLEAMLDYMITKELQDKEKKKYPRVKLHDDKAAILITL
ncbi:hypothetical protein [Macrococcus animalis]|uniref:hypothetical protein n=1 Tax=Macrococcus animalis TaxID=3395467 RepID=UPI0039BE06AA